MCKSVSNKKHSKHATPSIVKPVRPVQCDTRLSSKSNMCNFVRNKKSTPNVTPSYNLKPNCTIKGDTKVF